ncbi:nuclear transport factor 2 family protein [Pacificimonas sp. ICDLI1SI03]
MNREDEATERAAIRDLQSIYNTEGDRGRIDALVQVFTIDGTLEILGDEHGGRNAIHRYLTDVWQNGAPNVDLSGSRHHLSTSRIEFTGPETAQGWTYFFVMRRGKVVQEGTYVDRFTKSGSEWLISHRRVKLVWTKGEA